MVAKLGTIQSDVEPTETGQVTGHSTNVLLNEQSDPMSDLPWHLSRWLSRLTFLDKNMHCRLSDFTYRAVSVWDMVQDSSAQNFLMFLAPVLLNRKLNTVTSHITKTSEKMWGRSSACLNSIHPSGKVKVETLSFRGITYYDKAGCGCR